MSYNHRIHVGPLYGWRVCQRRNSFSFLPIWPMAISIDKDKGLTSFRRNRSPLLEKDTQSIVLDESLITLYYELTERNAWEQPPWLHSTPSLQLGQKNMIRSSPLEYGRAPPTSAGVSFSLATVFFEHWNLNRRKRPGHYSPPSLSPIILVQDPSCTRCPPPSACQFPSNQANPCALSIMIGIMSSSDPKDVFFFFDNNPQDMLKMQSSLTPNRPENGEWNDTPKSYAAAKEWAYPQKSVASTEPGTHHDNSHNFMKCLQMEEVNSQCKNRIEMVSNPLYHSLSLK